MGKLESLAVLGVLGGIAYVGYSIWKSGGLKLPSLALPSIGEVLHREEWEEYYRKVAEQRAEINRRIEEQRREIIESVRAGVVKKWIEPETGRPTVSGLEELKRRLGEKYFPVSVEMARFDY